MTRPRNLWILFALALGQPGCFLPSWRDGDEGKPVSTPRILRPGDHVYSTVDPPNNDPNSKPSTESKEIKKVAATGEKGDGVKGAQGLDLPPLPPVVLPGPPPVVGTVTSQSRTLGDPSSIEIPLPPMFVQAGVGDKLPKPIAPAPPDEPPQPTSLPTPPVDRMDRTAREPLETALSNLLGGKKVADLSAQEVSKIYDQLGAMMRELRPRTPLIIEKACFCEKVNSFGNYQPCSDGHVYQTSSSARPGERPQLGERVELYVEVRNFASVLRDGFYETRLASSIEIAEVRSGLKKTIWSYAFNEKRHSSHSPRTDHFNNYSFNVPPMPPGEYVLTIHIADETLPESRRETSESLPFRVGTRQ